MKQRIEVNRPTRRQIKYLDVHNWREQLEKLGWFLSKIGPDDPCCGGLTPRQCTILGVLAHSSGERLSDLAQATGITQSAMTRALERLEKQGMLQRVHGALKDGRATTIAITPRGRDARTLLEKMMTQRTKRVLDEIPASSRNDILSALRALNHAFETSECCGLDPLGMLRKAKSRLHSRIQP